MSEVCKRQDPSRSSAIQDICIKRLPNSKIKSEILKSDCDFVLEFCRGVWGGLGTSSSFELFCVSLLSNRTGYFVRQKHVEGITHRGPETANHLCKSEQLRFSFCEKGTQITDHSGDDINFHNHSCWRHTTKAGSACIGLPICDQCKY